MNLFRNTLARSAPLLLAYAFSVVLAPIMLARLGLAQFGVWAVTGALAGYLRLLDFGITGSLARFVALFDARGDRRGVRECVGLGLAGATVVALAAAVAAVAGAGPLSHALGVLPPEQMRAVLLSSVGIMVFNAYATVVVAVPFGMRQMVPPAVAGAIGNAVNFAASVGVLAVSSRLTDYAFANLGAAVVAFLLQAYTFLRVVPAPYVARPTRARAREIAGFGVKTQLVTIAVLVNQQTDKIIIAMLVGARAAGAYEVAARVGSAVRALGHMTLGAMIPTATAALVERGRSVIRDFYRRYTQRSLAISYPLYGAACVSIPYLFVAWLGHAPHDAELILLLLTLVYVPTMATGVAMTLVTSDGQPGVVARTAAIVAGLNIVATLSLAPLFGLWGVLGGTFLAEAVGSSIFLLRFHRLYRIPARDLARAVVQPLALAIGLAVPFVVWYALGAHAPTSRWGAVPGLVIAPGTYLVAYWLVASRLDLLPERLTLRRLRRVAPGLRPETSA